jgi:hypothetical protein
MTRAATLLALLLPLAGAGGLARAETPQGPTGASLPDGTLVLSPARRGYVTAPPSAFVAPAGEVISPIIWVNRCRGGCSFTVASLSDALSNQTIIDGGDRLPRGTRFNLSEFGYDDTVWNATLDCIRRVYQPFGVEIVTEDPGNVPHHEAVLAGRSTEAGYPANMVLGVAPLDSSTCRPQNNVISFSFANDHGPSPLDMCWTVAQESAHAFGLDHSRECSDPLTYIRTSQQCTTVDKYFRNLDSKCGEFADRACLCGGTQQNTFARLLGVHGPGSVPVAPPVVEITMPRDGASVQPGFSVYPTAKDPRGVNHLELWVNGWKWNEIPGVWQKETIYVLDVPRELPDGVMDIVVKGCGDTGVCGEDEITVTRGAPCSTAANCLEGQKCEQGKCFWDPPTLELGASCGYAQECLSVRCAAVDGEDICTEDCVTGPNDSCPEGWECRGSGALGSAGVCGPVVDGGCCSTGGSTGGLLVNLGLGGMIGLLVARRRRRR